MEVEGQPGVMEEPTGVGQVLTTVQVREGDHLPLIAFRCFSSCFIGTCTNNVRYLVCLFMFVMSGRVDGFTELKFLPAFALLDPCSSKQMVQCK